MSELKPCPFCGEMPETDGRLVQCYLMPCSARNFKMLLDSWNTRPIEDALNKRIAELEGIIKSDDERLTEAGLKVNLYFGCDTAEIMAEEILSSRARIAELEGDNDALKTENAELKERIGFLEINAIVYSSGQMGYIARIAELEAENKEYRLLIQDWIDIFDPQFTERLSFIDGVRLAMIEAVKESEE